MSDYTIEKTNTTILAESVETEPRAAHTYYVGDGQPNIEPIPTWSLRVNCVNGIFDYAEILTRGESFTVKARHLDPLRDALMAIEAITEKAT